MLVSELVEAARVRSRAARAVADGRYLVKRGEGRLEVHAAAADARAGLPIDTAFRWLVPRLSVNSDNITAPIISFSAP